MCPSESGTNKSRADVPGLLKNAIKLAESLETRWQTYSEMLDRLWSLLAELETLLEEDTGRKQRKPKAAKLAPGPAPTLRDIRLDKDGAAVTLDHSKQVPLSPALLDLLEILADDDGKSPDELVAWKSFDKVAGILEERFGRAFSRHAVSQLLLRLRKSLLAAGYGEGLVESVPGLGVRLRLKRTARPVPD